MRTAHAVLALVTLTAPAAAAEMRQVWESPAATVEQTVGITDIAVKYHRPAVKARDVWGKLVPYGKVWRAGANDATTISFSTPVKIAGQAVPAGTYALFVLPTADKWTFIFSKKPDQWGAYFYDPKTDLLRIDARPQAGAAREWLTYEIEPTSKNTAALWLAWDKLRGSFPIEVDVDGLYQAYLGTEVAKAGDLPDAKQRFATYFTAAKYWIGRGEKLDLAGSLLDKAAKAQPSFWVYEYRARLLQQQGNVNAALPLLDKAKQESLGKAPREYGEGLDALRNEWTKGGAKKN